MSRSIVNSAMWMNHKLQQADSQQTFIRSQTCQHSSLGLSVCTLRETFLLGACVTYYPVEDVLLQQTSGLKQKLYFRALLSGNEHYL